MRPEVEITYYGKNTMTTRQRRRERVENALDVILERIEDNAYTGDAVVALSLTLGHLEG